MSDVVISAHNPMTGPRHLGHYASTMAHWPKIAERGDLIVVIDDLIATLLYPGGRQHVEARTLAVVRECLATGIDFGRNYIVLTSMVPEAHEVALFAGMVLEHAWFEDLYRESFAGILSSYQRDELGLPRLASMAEVFYPQCHLAALTLGLRAAQFQGGEEMRGYMHIMKAIAAEFEVLTAPDFMGGAPFVLGTDGEHMGTENAIFVSAPSDEIAAQAASVSDAAVFLNWAEALANSEVASLAAQGIVSGEGVNFDGLKAKATQMVVEALQPFRETRLADADLVSVLERSSRIARERVAATAAALKSELRITGFG